MSAREQAGPATAPNALIAEGRHELEERPATGKQSAETVRRPDAARGRAGSPHDLLHGPDIPDHPPDDLQAGGIVLPDFGVADSVAVEVADSVAAAAGADSVAAEVAAEDAVRILASSTISCC